VGGVEDARRLHRFKVVAADRRWALAGRPSAASVVGHAQATLGAAAHGLRSDVGGTAERREHTGLRAAPGLVVVLGGARVVEGSAPVGASLASRSQGQADA
jgi:hypothetical protein